MKDDKRERAPGCSHPHHEMFDGLDPASVDVFRAFKRAMRLNRQLLARMTAIEGGHPAQAGCLWALARHDGISQRELAEMLHIAPATVTAMVQRMEREGSIERWTDPDDQRVTRIRLTEAGRAQSRAMGEAHVTYISTVLDPLSEADRRELARILDLLSDNVAKELDS